MVKYKQIQKYTLYFANNNFKIKKANKKMSDWQLKNSINEQSYCLFSHLKALLKQSC